MEKVEEPATEEKKEETTEETPVEEKTEEKEEVGENFCLFDVFLPLCKSIFFYGNVLLFHFCSFYV